MDEKETQPDPKSPKNFPPSGDPIAQVRLLRKFHIRIGLLFGGAMLAMVAGSSTFFYKTWISWEFAALQQRLLSIATSLAQTIDAQKMLNYPVEYDENSEYHTELLRCFETIAKNDPDVATIYLLRPTEVPTQLRFFIDYVKTGAFGKPGEAYSAANTPLLLTGFDRPTVEDRPYEDAFGPTLSGYAPVKTKEGRSVGIVGLDVKVSRLAMINQKVLNMTLAMVGACLALVLASTTLVARSIRKPLQELVDGTKALAAGNLEEKLKMKRTDEFGVLGECFNKMAVQLNERQVLRDLFGKYVSEEIAKAVLSSDKTPVLGGQEAVVTVLMSDLCNYSTISERIAPTQIVRFLNQYLEAMNSVVDSYKGCVIEFLGDGIFVVFGAPCYYQDHAEQAVQCAIKMREKLQELNDFWEREGASKNWQALGIDKIDFRIGLHTGQVITGNLGSSKRMKYSVIGDTVNVAARLETMNKQFKTSILMSEEVKSSLSSPLMNQVASRGPVTVKGRKNEIFTYSI